MTFGRNFMNIYVVIDILHFAFSLAMVYLNGGKTFYKSLSDPTLHISVQF